MPEDLAGADLDLNFCVHWELPIASLGIWYRDTLLTYLYHINQRNKCQRFGTHSGLT
jgi:hypothetical protein